MVNDSSSSSSSWRSMSSDRMCPICLETFNGVDSTASALGDRECSSHDDVDHDDDGGETSPLLLASSSGNDIRNLQSYHVTTTTTTTATTTTTPTSTGGCTNSDRSPTITFACGHVVCEPCWESLLLHNERHRGPIGVLTGVTVAAIAVRCPICRAIVLGEENDV